MKTFHGKRYMRARKSVRIGRDKRRAKKLVKNSYWLQITNVLLDFVSVVINSDLMKSLNDFAESVKAIGEAFGEAETTTKETE